MDFKLIWNVHGVKMISKFPPPWNFKLAWVVHKFRRHQNSNPHGTFRVSQYQFHDLTPESAFRLAQCYFIYSFTIRISSFATQVSQSVRQVSQSDWQVSQSDREVSQSDVDLIIGIRYTCIFQVKLNGFHNPTLT